MGFWGELGKFVASGMLDSMESAAKNVARNSNDPEKAANAMRTAESARRLRSEYFGDDD